VLTRRSCFSPHRAPARPNRVMTTSLHPPPVSLTAGGGCFITDSKPQATPTAPPRCWGVRPRSPNRFVSSDWLNCGLRNGITDRQPQWRSQWFEMPKKKQPAVSRGLFNSNRSPRQPPSSRLVHRHPRVWLQTGSAIQIGDDQGRPVHGVTPPTEISDCRSPQIGQTIPTGGRLAVRGLECRPSSLLPTLTRNRSLASRTA